SPPNNPTMTIQMTSPHMAHNRCTRLKCSTLSHRPFRHAHALPFAPSTKGMMIVPRNGTRASNATNVLLPTPHIQLSKKAPQFQRLISRGTTLGSLRTGGSIILRPVESGNDSTNGRRRLGGRAILSAKSRLRADRVEQPRLHEQEVRLQHAARGRAVQFA